MNMFVQAIDKDGNEILGSDGARIVKDLKTFRGVYNRTMRYKNTFNKRTKELRFYRYTNIYDEDTFTLVHTVSIN